MSEFQESTGSDRRVHQRLEDGRASLVELGGDNCGIVLNISEGGMAILSAEDLNGGNGLRNLRFQAPEFEHWIETEAEIAWISDSKKQAGVRFKGLSDTTRTQLRAGISIAVTRARLASQVKQAGTTAEGQEDLTDSIPPSFATTVTADSPALVVAESTQVSSEVNPNSPVEKFEEKIIEDEGQLHSDGSEAASDSRFQEAPREMNAIETAILRPESKSSEESNKDTQTQLLNLADTEPQTIPASLALDTRLSSPPPQKSALAEMRFRNLVANSGVKQSGDYRGIAHRSDISYGKWAAVGAIAILASLLAFMVGWILGDPSRVKLGH